MDENDRFRPMSRIVEELKERIADLENGALDMQGMEQALADLRELEERVIVIRFKGLERVKEAQEESSPAPEEPVKQEIPLPPEDEVVDAPDMLSEAPTPRRNSPSIPDNQISLIDSIEEISRESSINERMKEQSGPTLAQKLRGGKLEQLSKAFSLNQRVGVVKHLFMGDETLFKETLTRLDNCADLDSALGVAEEAIGSAWNEEDKQVKQFVQILERRFA